MFSYTCIYASTFTTNRLIAYPEIFMGTLLMSYVFAQYRKCLIELDRVDEFLDEMHKMEIDKLPRG